MASLKKHHVKGHVYYALERSFWDPSSQTVKRKYLRYLGRNPRDSFRVSEDLRSEHREAIARRKRETVQAQREALHGAGKKKITSGFSRTGRKRRSERRYRKRIVHKKKLTGIEKQNLRNFVYRSNPGLIDQDIDSYIDPDLSYHENKRLLADHFGLDEEDRMDLIEAAAMRAESVWSERISETPSWDSEKMKTRYGF